MSKKKRIYTSISNNIFGFGFKQLLITEHALLRARQREIMYPDEILACIQQGRIERLGKQKVRIHTKNIACICEVQERYVKIITVVRL